MLSHLFATVVFSLLVSGCAEGAPSRANAEPATVAARAHSGPALWVVKDPDTTIYLFGTVHMLPQGFAWRNAAFDKAFDSADTLVMEVVGVENSAETQPAIMKIGFTPGLPKLAERVPADARDDLAAAIKHAGVPATALDPMETWLATMTLSTARIVRLGYGIDSGVESELKARATTQRKRVEGLETVEEQLSFFDTLPEDEQRKLLVLSLDDMDAIQKIIDTAVKDWAAGDVDKVAAVLEEDIKSSPQLAKRLLADRNANWAEWIDKRLKTTPGTVFVAVGTGHLAGAESVQAKLKAKGIAAERLN